MNNIETKKPNNFVRFIFLFSAILLLINWLFHPQFGIFYNPCIDDAISRGVIGFEDANAWKVLFTQSSKINEIYNNGAMLELDSCGYQWGKKSNEELFFFGPLVIVFTLLLLSMYSVGYKKTLKKLSKKNNSD